MGPLGGALRLKKLIAALKSLDLKKDFAKRTIWVICVAAVGAIATAVYKNAGSLETWIAQHQLAIITLLNAAMFVGSITLVRRAQRARAEADILAQQEFDFEILEKAVSYECHNRTAISYRRRYKLRALRDGLDTYKDKFHWTGAEVPSVKSNTRGHVVTLTVKRNIWQLFDIRFDRALTKGGEIETEVLWEVTDTAKRSVPFISIWVEEPTKVLTLRVAFPSDLGIYDVVRESSYSLGAKVPYSTVAAKTDDHGVHTWQVPEPKLLHSYALNWTWPA